MKIVTTDEMRGLEKATDAAGWTYGDMMEAAGKTVAARAVGEFRFDDRMAHVHGGFGRRVDPHPGGRHGAT